VEDEYLYKVVDALDEVAKETGKTVPQIALNWLFERPTVVNVIMGARNEEQLGQNLGSVGWNLTKEKEQVAKLDAASNPPTLTGTSVNSPTATPSPPRHADSSEVKLAVPEALARM
jgi:aryl-alcohol dehydrogenase-like predicted oxidoreductase